MPSGRWRISTACLALGVVCLASAATIVVLGTRLTFFNDDWQFLLQRPGLTADSVFAPHNGHLSALLVLAYKSLVAVFGLGSQVPFRVLLGVAVAAVGVIVYLMVGERAGRALGLIAATLVVFLGAAWEDLLFFASLSVVGALAAGLAALLALERDTPRRNAAACALLVCSVAIFDLGLSFVAAAAIAVALRRRPRQLWVAAVPAALFGIWWLAYGSDAASHVSVSNLEHLPRYVIESVGSGLASIAGLNRGGLVGAYAGGLPTNYRRGHVLLLIVAVGLVVWWFRGGRPSPRVLVPLGAALTFWVLAGANYFPGREPFASRYQLVDAVLLILIAAELLRPVRLGRWQTGAVAGLALVALALNLVTLGHGMDFMRDHAAYAKTDLGALAIARGRAPAGFRLVEPIARDPYLSGVTAGRYFRETAAHGSPSVYSPGRIAAAPPAQRQAADSVLVAAYGVVTTPAPRAGPAASNACRRLPPGAGEGVEIPTGGADVTNVGGSALELAVRRFAPPGLSHGLGALGPGSTVRLAIPTDRATPVWHLAARGGAPLEVCPTARPRG